MIYLKCYDACFTLNVPHETNFNSMDQSRAGINSATPRYNTHITWLVHCVWLKYYNKSEMFPQLASKTTFLSKG